MRDLRTKYTYPQRLEFQECLNTMRYVLVPVLKRRQQGLCNACSKPLEAFDIDHELYNPMMTIEHVQLLCIPCHKAKTNYIPFRNR